MLRRLTYLVCTVEAALLAAILVAAVVEPGLAGPALSPRTRQFYAVGALVLIVGCCYAVFCWLRDVLTGWERLSVR
jgi:dolichyl-phosphate-mannose--protein O-mannosyl transferase